MIAEWKWEIKKFRRSLRDSGIAGTALHILLRIVNMLRPSRRRECRKRDAAMREFDRRYNVETAGEVSLARLEIDSVNKEHGVDYVGIDPDWFHTVLQASGADVEGRVFVDFGCGKGRAILLAATYPFKRIVGVEFSPQLADCWRNLPTYQSPGQVCRDIEVVRCDAADFPIPDDPLVLFFYNPFGAEVMGRVVGNVRRSLEEHPRPLTVIYCYPMQERFWASFPSLRKTVSTRLHCIYSNGESAHR